MRWQPTDRDADALASIAAWQASARLPNLAPPLRLDAADLATWPAGPFDAVVCINMVHISPWAATEGLMAGAGRVLTPGGRLFLYGPFLEADVETAWGLRDLAEVTALAHANGLGFAERIAMPANNLVVMFEKRA